MRNYCVPGLILLLLCLPVQSAADTVDWESLVLMHYTVVLEDETPLESNEGQEPLEFVLRPGCLLLGFEERLIGMEAGDSKTIVLKPEQAFGEVDPEAVKRLPLKTIPRNHRKVGRQLRLEDDQGRSLVGQVQRVGEKTVTMDFNHPLAGKSLLVHVRIFDVESR